MRGMSAEGICEMKRMNAAHSYGYQAWPQVAQLKRIFQSLRILMQIMVLAVQRLRNEDLHVFFPATSSQMAKNGIERKAKRFMI